MEAKKMPLTLRAVRINAGLSRQEVASACGCSVDTVARWEQGKTFPNAKDLQTLLPLYKVDYKDLNF